MLERLKRAHEAAKLAIALLALILPAGPLVTLGHLPVELADTAVFVLPLLGLALIVAIMMLGSSIRALSQSRAVALVLIGAAAAGTACFVYYRLTDVYVAAYPLMDGDQLVDFQSQIAPLAPSRELHDLICRNECSYTAALLDAPGHVRARVIELMEAQNASATAAIVAALLCTYLLFVTTIVGGLWWLVESTPRPAAGPATSP